MNRFLLIVGAAAVVAMAIEVRGQGKIEMPDGRPIPVETLKDVDGVTRIAWVAAKGFKPLQSPKKSLPVLLGGELANGFPFMYVASLIAEYQGDDREYILLGRDSGNGEVEEYYGWVPRDFLVVDFPFARKVQPQTLEDRIDSEGKTVHRRTSGLYQKVRLANTRESIKEAQANNEKDISGVPVRLAPFEGVKPEYQYQLATLFFVYQETKDFVLIGRQQSFTDGKLNEDKGTYKTRIIRGWVPRDRVVRWNTRQALAWNWWNTAPTAQPRRSEAGVVFGSYVEKGSEKIFDVDQTLAIAKQFLKEKGSATKVADSIAFPEEFTSLNSLIDGQSVAKIMSVLPSHVDVSPSSAQGNVEVSRPFESNKTRHPILSEPKNIREKGMQNIVYHVGYSNGLDGGQFLEQQLAAAMAATKKLDLVILVDQTSSMNRYFPAVAEAIALIFKDADRQAEERDIRVSVSFYGDSAVAGAFEINPLVPLQGGATADRLVDDYLKKVVPYSDIKANPEQLEAKRFFAAVPGGQMARQGDVIRILRDVHFHDFKGGQDPLEDVLLGIRNMIALPEAKGGFRPDSQKLLLVIGDRGDKSEAGRTPKTAQKDRAIADVVDLLTPRIGTPIGLFGINVDDSNHVDGRLFGEQMTLIKDELYGRYKDDPRSVEIVAGYIDYSSQRTSVSQLVKAQYERVKKVSDQVREDVREIAEGNFQKKIGPAVRQLLLFYKIDPDKLQSMKGAEVFEEGLIWKYSPQEEGLEQARVHVLLNESELIGLIRRLESWVGPEAFAGDTGTGGEILDTIVEAIEKNAGQGLDVSTASDILDVGELDLPAQTPMMQMTPKRIRELQQTAAGRKELQADLMLLRVKLKRLTDLLGVDLNQDNQRKKGVRADWRVEPGQDAAGRTVDQLIYKHRLEEDRVFTFPNDESSTRWYWIDLLEEYP